MAVKKKILCIFILGILLVCTGCGNGKKQDGGSAGANAPSENADTKLKTIKFGVTTATAQLTESALVAQKLGYLDEELAAVGYKAEYIGFAGAGPAVNEAFAAGEIDYAFCAEFPVITARSNGVDIKAIGVINQEANYALLVTEKSGIKSAADIAGKKIIVTPGTILYKYFGELCEENNLNVNDVNIVNAMTDAQAVLAGGDADGLIINYSGALMYENRGLGKVVADSTSNLDYASGMVLAGRGEFIKNNPDVNKALLRALKRAAEYANNNPDKSYELMSTEAFPTEIMRKTYSYDTSFNYFSPEFSDTYMERAGRVYEFAKGNSLLGEEIELSEVFDSTYVNEVMEE